MQGREKAQKSLFGTRPLDELLPSDHPLRKIRADFDAAYARLSDAFETNYGTTGNVSVPTAVLIRAWLLMALYSIKSERALCEQIAMNAGFRWCAFQLKSAGHSKVIRPPIPKQFGRPFQRKAATPVDS